MFLRAPAQQAGVSMTGKKEMQQTERIRKVNNTHHLKVVGLCANISHID